MFSRRHLLAAASITAVGLSACTAPSATGPDASPASGGGSDGGGGEMLRIHHPSTLAFAAPFAIMAAEAPAAAEISTWDSPDVLRSLLTSDGTDLAAAPSYVGANLFNRGIGIRLTGITVWGMMHLMGPAGGPEELAGLKGKTVAVPMAGDMPDLVFRILLTKAGLDPETDLTISNVAEGSEIVSQLVSGKVDYAVLMEHAATLATIKAAENGREVLPLIDLQQEWASATGQEARIPQAGMVVTQNALDSSGDAVTEQLTRLSDAIGKINDGDSASLQTIAEATQVPLPVVQKAAPRLHLEYVPATEARASLEAFYTELGAINPKIYGEKLPAADFYLDDLR